MKHSKKIASVAGKLLMVVSFVFIARQIMRYDVDFSALASPLAITGLFFTAVVFGLGVVFAGLNYGWLIANITGVSLDRRLVVRVYCVSNLYKYLPGSVMYLIGRNRIAFETKEVSHAQVALATVMEGVFILAATVIVIAFSVYEEAVQYFREVTVPFFVWMIAAGVALVCAVLAAVLRSRLRVWSKKISESMGNFTLAAKAKRLGVALFIIVVLALTYLVTLVLSGQPVSLEMVPVVMGLYMLAWLAGFLTPGAASGMGIREAVLIMFLGGHLNPAIVLSSALMHRVISIVGDVLAYGVALAYSHAKR